MFTCDKYAIDTEIILVRLAPYFWIITPETKQKKTVWVAFLKLVSFVFRKMQIDLLENCQQLHEFLEPTGQHLSLEKFLNDRHDNALRRIYITEYNRSIINYIWYLQSDNKDNKVWYLQSETDTLPKIWNLQSELNNIINFAVNIPNALSGTIDESELLAWINNYIVNGYKIEIIYF